MFEFQRTALRKNLDFRRAEVIYQEEKFPRLCTSNIAIEAEFGLRHNCWRICAVKYHVSTVSSEIDLSRLEILSPLGTMPSWHGAQTFLHRECQKIGRKLNEAKMAIDVSLTYTYALNLNFSSE
mgnify:FL=1